MCVLFLPTTLVLNIYFKKGSGKFYYKMYTDLQEKHLLVLSDFNKSWISLIGLRKSFQYQVLRKSA
jgi:hypothetical protein